MVTGGGKRAAGWSPFKWVNTTLGNVKAAIAGTYRRVSPEHAGRYLASFAWRYNRRFQLESLIPRLVHSAGQDRPAALRQARRQLTFRATQVRLYPPGRAGGSLGRWRIKCQQLRNECNYKLPNITR